jgi:hypothetical protein
MLIEGQIEGVKCRLFSIAQRLRMATAKPSAKRTREEMKDRPRPRFFTALDPVLDHADGEKSREPAPEGPEAYQSAVC